MAVRDVIITGLGLTTPLGSSVSENWTAVRSMNTGISLTPKEGLPEFLQYAGTVSRYDLPGDIPPRQTGQMKFLNRGALLGFCAAAEALASSKESINTIDPGRKALYVASGDHTKIGYDFMYPAVRDSADRRTGAIDYARLNESALNKVNPFFLLESLNNNLFSFLSAYAEFMGPNTSLASLSPCGGNALELAYRSISQNRADAALAVGYGSWISDLSLYELEGLGILSQCREGRGSFKPFDRRRDGFIPGEGGAALLLESAESAEKRGSSMLAKVRECGNCSEFSSREAFSVHEEVVGRNIRGILESASISPGDLAFIIPHGSGTRKGDRSEMKSLAEIFTSRGQDTLLCGLKPYTGHMGAASDIAEVIFGILAVKEHLVPATLNFRETEKEFSSLKISASPEPCSGSRFLSISYGVGGQSSSVIVEVY